jgi:chromosome segregation ATPase
VGTKTAAMSEELAKKRRELRDLEPTLMQARTKHEQLVHELRQLDGKLGALEQRQTAGAQATHLAEAELKALAQEESLFGKSVETSSVETSRVRRLKLEAELGEIEARLHASKSDQRESERERRSAEAVQKLMRIYPAVHGRMVDLCKPTEAIYRTALTVAMGKNMDAVVVDDEKAAIECIQQEYLKLLTELEALESVAAVDERAITLRERLATKRLEAEAAKDDLRLTSTKLSKLQEEHKVIKKESEKASKELRTHETAKEKLDAELRQLAEQCAQVEDRIFAAFSKRVRRRVLDCV